MGGGDPYRERIIALDRVQNKAAKFARYRNDSKWETLAQRKKMARICVHFKSFTGELTWKVIDYKSHAI
jgi:hypothetical protein